MRSTQNSMPLHSVVGKTPQFLAARNGESGSSDPTIAPEATEEFVRDYCGTCLSDLPTQEEIEGDVPAPEDCTIDICRTCGGLCLYWHDNGFF